MTVDVTVRLVAADNAAAVWLHGKAASFRLTNYPAGVGGKRLVSPFISQTLHLILFHPGDTGKVANTSKRNVTENETFLEPDVTPLWRPAR